MDLDNFIVNPWALAACVSREELLSLLQEQADREREALDRAQGYLVLRAKADPELRETLRHRAEMFQREVRRRQLLERQRRENPEQYRKDRERTHRLYEAQVARQNAILKVYENYARRRRRAGRDPWPEDVYLAHRFGDEVAGTVGAHRAVARSAGWPLRRSRESTPEQRREAVVLMHRVGLTEAVKRTGWSKETIARWAKAAGIGTSRSARRRQERQRANARRAALEKARASRRTHPKQRLQPGLVDREVLLARGVPEWIVDKCEAS